jgi:hypothetical protein
VHSFSASFGRIYVFYPEASVDRCTAALLLDVDPVALIRGQRGQGTTGFALEQYVNDRPCLGPTGSTTPSTSIPAASSAAA